MQKTYLSGLLLACSVALTGCEKDEPAIRYDPVVVWASYADESYLPELFSAFTEETGVPVNVQYAREELHLYNLIENIGSEPADVFLTRNIEHLVRAADEGALRPIRSDGLAEVADALKDSDGLWTAINFQKTQIIQGPARAKPAPDNVYALAEPAFKGKLCLSSSRLTSNQDMVAMMIADIDVKPAERVVRGWVSNLAEPPFADESALLDAVENGVCEIAIVSGWGASRMFSNADSALAASTPQPGYLQIEAVGVGRHSRYPQSAYRLIDWLLSEAVSSRHAVGVVAYPPVAFSATDYSGQPASTAGWRHEDAILLIERAAYR